MGGSSPPPLLPSQYAKFGEGRELSPTTPGLPAPVQSRPGKTGGRSGPAGGKRSAPGAAGACVLGSRMLRGAVAIAGFSQQSLPGAGGWPSPRGPVTGSHWFKHQGTHHLLPPGFGREAEAARRRCQGAEQSERPFVW